VDVSAAAGDRSAKLKVVDHGPGIRPGEHDRIFSAFERGDDAAATSGVGLGLTVARGFVEAMDGVLIADSTDGGGLTMRLRLPLAT
jgi:two-component system sensor histidine kinase KdpD